MTKYVIRLASILIILSVSVPFLISAKADHNYSLPLDSSTEVSLLMPDGSLQRISTEEYFAGAAAAYLPHCTDEESLRALFVMLSTPELTADGVYYLTPQERTQLYGSEYDKLHSLYSRIAESVRGQSLILPNEDILPLTEYIYLLEQCEGVYTDRLAGLFPGGGLKTEHIRK